MYPANAGAAGQFLQTDGFGNLTWRAVSGMLPSPAADKASLRYTTTGGGQWIQDPYVLLEGDSTGGPGSIELLAQTAGAGSLYFKAADSAGAFRTTIINASQAQNRQYTIPDAGSDARFVMTEGTQTINGAKTFANLILGNDLNMNGKNIVNVLNVRSQPAANVTLEAL